MAWPQTGDPAHIVCPNCASVNRVAAGLDPRKAKCGRCHTRLFSGKVWPATQKSFFQQINRSDIPVVVDFWAEWCGPCKVMAPFYDEVTQALEPGYRFLKLDTEAEPDIAAHYQIRAIPTVILFYRGREIARRPGLADRQTLEAWLGQQKTAA